MSAIGQSFAGRAALLQRVLSAYRVPVFEDLALRCGRGLSVAAGEPMSAESIAVADRLEHAQLVRVRNRRLLGGPLAVFWQSGVTDWLERWQPDVLIMEANPRYLSSRPAIGWMHKRGRPVLGWGLGTISLSRGLEGLRRSARARYLRSFDGMIAYSSRAAKDYMALGFPRDRVFVARNAMARRPAAATPPQRPQQVDGSPTVLFVGRINEGKRLDLLIRAVATLPSPPQLRIVGEGPARADVESLARSVFPSAQFLGAKHGADLAAAFREADLFVLPGLGGLAIQEAMSHGLPVVVAEADGTQEDLVRPENGWNVAPGDLTALSKVLREALSDVPRLRRMGAESLRIVTEEINVEAMVDTFVEALNAIAPASGGGG
jgi:glycosyltransferase involved in cell wall biosynthesis